MYIAFLFIHVHVSFNNMHYKEKERRMFFFFFGNEKSHSNRITIFEIKPTIPKRTNLKSNNQPYNH